MNKMNKKGFTLIEMLVVIAIIAVLVSIIIPTVTSATDKAAAAANAANLRSVKAEIVTSYLTNDTSRYTFSGGKVTATGSASALKVDWKTVGTSFTVEGYSASAPAFEATYSGDVITVKCYGATIQQWANAAGNKAAK